MASIEWLEQELSTIDAAVILVAHDRWFLESVSTSVLELEGGRSTFFPGKWHVWRQEKAARLANQAKWAERQAEDIARLERFVARFRYGTKSRQAQAKLKQIERIEAVRVEAPRGGRRTLGFEFLKPARSGRMVIEAEGFDLAAGTKPLLEDAELVLERGEHVALIGPNGSGKSTLLEAIVGGRARPDRPRRRARLLLPARGRARRARQRARVRDGRDRPAARRRRRRSSGASSSPAGTRTRSRSSRSPAASGAGSRWRSSSLPARTSSCSTSRRTISISRAARRSRPRSRRFPARVLLVSHDRAVLDAVAERIVAVEDGTLRSYPGGWADYARDPRRRGRAAAPTAEGTQGEAEARAAEAAAPSELQRIEASIQERELELAELERRLAEDWGDAETLAAHKAARDDLQGLLERWEQLFESAQQA